MHVPPLQPPQLSSTRDNNLHPVSYLSQKRDGFEITFDGGYLVKKNAFKILVGIVGRKNK